MADGYIMTPHEGEQAQKEFREQTLQTLEALRNLYDEEDAAPEQPARPAQKPPVRPAASSRRRPNIRIEAEGAHRGYMQAQTEPSEQAPEDEDFDAREEQSETVQAAVAVAELEEYDEALKPAPEPGAEPEAEPEEDAPLYVDERYQRAMEDHERLEVFRRREQKRSLEQATRGTPKKPDQPRAELTKNPYASAAYVKPEHEQKPPEQGHVREIEVPYTPRPAAPEPPVRAPKKAKSPKKSKSARARAKTSASDAGAAKQPAPKPKLTRAEKKQQKQAKQRVRQAQKLEQQRQRDRKQLERRTAADARNAAARASVQRTKERLTMPAARMETDKRRARLLARRRQRWVRLFGLLLVVLIVLFSCAATWYVATHPTAAQRKASEQYNVDVNQINDITSPADSDTTTDTGALTGTDPSTNTATNPETNAQTDDSYVPAMSGTETQ